MPYIRKTRDEYLVEQLWSGRWEEVCAEETRKEAKEQLKCYRENQPVPVRVRKVRVKLSN